MGRLESKIAVVTGGAEGIGLAIAERYAAEGAKVIIASRNVEAGAAAVADLAAKGLTVDFVQTDVTKFSDLTALAAQIEKTHGRLEVLCLNHAAQGLDTPEILDLSEEAWDTLFDTNAKGVFFAAKALLPLMVKSGGGAVVTISSIGALARSSQAAYAASKAAALVLTKGIAAQMAEHNIRANIITPSAIDTPNRSKIALNSKYKNDAMAVTAEQVASGEAQIVSHVLPRFGQPMDVANLALFLASDEASYLTAMTFPVDGGSTRVRTD